MSEGRPACRAVECTLPAGRDDDLADLLSGLGILGTQVGPERAGILPITVYLRAPGRDLEGSVRAIVDELGGEVRRVVEVADEDWLQRYRQQVRPFTVGDSWWLDPHPEQPTSAPSGRIRLAIEPRTAFGSGSHESTQLVLLELEASPPERLSVLDVGTGSSILALAAERLGARLVVGFDIDLGAVFVARQIVSQQEWRSTVRLVAGPIDAFRPGDFQLVLCNMIWEHARPLLGAMWRVLAEDGGIVFSGLLASERADIVTEIGRLGLAVRHERTLGEWLCLRVGRG